MDPNGNIYVGDESQIPKEDKARLDGYLRGRADAHREARLREIEAKLDELEARAISIVEKHQEKKKEES